MKKKVKNGFFIKTFSVSLIMLLAITLAAYLLCYLLLPAFYRRYKFREYDRKAGILTQQLSTASEEAGEIGILSSFARNDRAGVSLYDDSNRLIFSIKESVGLSMTQMGADPAEADPGVDGVEYSLVIDDNEKPSRITAKYDYTNGAGMRRLLEFDIPVQPLDEAREILIQIYPVACLICIAFSFLLSMLFSHIVVQPIRKVQRTVREMAELKPDARISDSDGGAFGEMSSDINSMYEELRNTILDLEKQIRISSDSENRKIAFLRNVSHELKNPLASANALIEGMIYNVPPYCDDKEKYLTECRELLEKAITLTKESLNLSPAYHEEEKVFDLKEAILSEFGPYKVILKARQVGYSVDIPDDIRIVTLQNLFSKVISNILSNAANYTDPGGKTDIVFRDGKLMIDNTCTPLSGEELKDVMKPMHSGAGNDNRYSNGLGLFIVEQSLNLMKIPFSFAPIPDGEGRGMRFCIELPVTRSE